MKTVYFEHRSTMTAFAMLTKNATIYRTRLECECEDCCNRRNGILVVKGNTVVYRLIRCKSCAKEGRTQC